MRTRAALAFLLLVAGAAHAQAPLHELAGTFSDPSVPIGGATNLRLEASRLCPSGALVVPERDALVAVDAPAGITVPAPTAITFPQQVCAQQPRVVVPVELAIQVGDAASGGLATLAATLSVPDGGPLAPADRVEADLGLTVERTDTSSSTGGQGEPVKPAPVPGVALVAASLLGATAAARRRSRPPTIALV